MIVKYSYMDNLFGVSYSWNVWLWGKQVWIEHFDNVGSGLMVLGRGHGVDVRTWDRIKEVWNMMNGDKTWFHRCCTQRDLGSIKKKVLDVDPLDGTTSIGLGNVYRTHPCQDSKGSSHKYKRIDNYYISH
jgi:hypothetical protein